MNPNQPRNSNPILCNSMIFLGALCVLFTIASAFFLKDRIIDRISEPLSVEGIANGSQIDSIERQIQFKEQEIRMAQLMPDDADREKRMREAQENPGKLSDKKSAVNTNSSVFGNKAEKIKKLEDEKAELIAKKEELKGNLRVKNERKRSWRELVRDNSLSIELLFALIPLGALSFTFMRMTFFGAMPEKNPLSLTDFERRCIMFLIFSIVISAFGFFLFAFILTLIY